MIFAVPLALAALLVSTDADSDQDGLPDHQEVHKYFTDPNDADSDDDGVPDGEWDERREFAYTVRAVLDVLLPFDEASIVQDDYQDARVVDKSKKTVRLEVVHYPFNTNARAIDANPAWRREARRMKEWLEPGPTSNWDTKMQKQLLAELKRDGIDVEKLTDREAARQVARWLVDRAPSEDSFTTFAVEFERGRPEVHSKLRQRVQDGLKAVGRSEKEQWNRELFGKGMFENKVRGSCTSSAIYLQTALRAVGIPTRTVILVPVIDASDPAERLLLANVTHHGVRRLLEKSAAERDRSWASHTFNEVWVGGRWQRLNYHHLGQNSLFGGMMGLMTHVHTYRDHADAGLVAWGIRDAEKPDDVFGGSNPYSCVEIDDRFGAHCDEPNPEIGEPFQTLTVRRLYWFDDPTKPPVVAMRLDDPDTAGHLILHVAEGILGEGTGQYASFYERADKEFVLRAKAKGRAAHEVRAYATRGFWGVPEEGVRDFYLRIDPAEFTRMEKGVAYQLVARDQTGEFRFVVPKGVTIERE